MHRIATVTDDRVQTTDDDRRTQHCSIRAAISTVG